MNSLRRSIHVNNELKPEVMTLQWPFRQHFSSLSVQMTETLRKWRERTKTSELKFKTTDCLRQKFLSEAQEEQKTSIFTRRLKTKRRQRGQIFTTSRALLSPVTSRSESDPSPARVCRPAPHPSLRTKRKEVQIKLRQQSRWEGSWVMNQTGLQFSYWSEHTIISTI